VTGAEQRTTDARVGDDRDKPAGPRSRKGVRTRARLLEAAKEIFEEHGLTDARISDIAERAGLSYGSLYHYFSSKEEIFREVAAAQERALTIPAVDVGSGARGAAEDGAGDGVAEDGATTRAQVAASNRRYLDEYRSEARIMGVIEQVSRYDEVVNATRFERQRRYAEGLAAAIAQWQARDGADPELDPTIGSYVLVAMVTRFAESWFVQGRVDVSFDDGVDQLNRFWLNALGLDPPETANGAGRSGDDSAHDRTDVRAGDGADEPS
jgi:AcrR family transcriptional regulator